MKCLVVIATLAVLAGCTVSGMPRPDELPALSEVAQERRFAAWQNALEHNAAGRSTSWSLSGEVRGTIAPIDTYYSSIDGWCRNYEEVMAAGAKQYRLVGIACRKPGPRWLILDVRPFAEGDRRQ
jgi:surface antigen